VVKLEHRDRKFFSVKPPKRSLAFRYRLGGSQGGKELALQQHCCTTTTTTKVRTLFPGFSPTHACGAREGRRENLGTRLPKYKIAGYTQYKKLDKSYIKEGNTALSLILK